MYRWIQGERCGYSARFGRFSAGVTGDFASCELFFLGADYRIGPLRRVIHRNLDHRIALLEF
jgi:hypothetical protein